MPEKNKMKCYMPNCNKEVPKWRIEKGFITCSKKCSNAWSWVSSKLRGKIKLARKRKWD